MPVNLLIAFSTETSVLDWTKTTVETLMVLICLGVTLTLLLVKETTVTCVMLVSLILLLSLPS